jgi:hypothetical protein
MRPARRWFQFRLRTLLLLFVVCALCLMPFARVAVKRWQERRVAEELVAQGYQVTWRNDAQPPSGSQVVYQPSWAFPQHSTTQPPSWSEVLRHPSRFHDALWRRFEHVSRIDAPRNTRSPRFLPPDLSSLTDLEMATVADNGSPAEMWESLATAPALRALAFNFDRRLDPNGCHWLLRCERLEYLTCRGRVDDEGLNFLAGLHNLRDLRIYDCRSATDAGFDAMKGLQKLESLCFDESNMSDRGLKSLSLLPHLKYLRPAVGPNIPPSAWRITDDGLRSLAGLRELEYLEIAANARGLDLGGIGEMPRLVCLTIFSQAFTDDSLPELMKIRNCTRTVYAVPRMSQAAKEQLRKAGWHVAD